MRIGAVVIGLFSMLLGCVELDVPLYDQTVDYKTACESVATVATLNYLGYDVTIDEFLDKYLDTVGMWDNEVFNREANVFDHYFVGDPRTSQGLLCNPPVIVEAVGEYFDSVGEKELKALDTSGVGFRFLIDEVAKGNPVVLWITHGCENTEARDWYGSPFFARSHTVVLSGYDLDKGVVYITDSVDGYVEIPYSQAKNNYEFAGMRSVVIK